MLRIIPLSFFCPPKIDVALKITIGSKLFFLKKYESKIIFFFLKKKEFFFLKKKGRGSRPSPLSKTNVEKMIDHNFYNKIFQNCNEQLEN
jgi:hypothetical protein